jgi:hypothetical protein
MKNPTGFRSNGRGGPQAYDGRGAGCEQISASLATYDPTLCVGADGAEVELQAGDSLVMTRSEQDEHDITITAVGSGAPGGSAIYLWQPNMAIPTTTLDFAFVNANNPLHTAWLVFQDQGRTLYRPPRQDSRLHPRCGEIVCYDVDGLRFRGIRNGAQFLR